MTTAIAIILTIFVSFESVVIYKMLRIRKDLKKGSDPQ